MYSVNIARLERNLRAAGEIGAGEGITRLALSPEFFCALDIVEAQMRDAGLATRRDKLGNLYGRRAGMDDSLPVIMAGSHLDTVRNGGLYDGNLGIAASIECINMMNDYKISTLHPIEIAALNCEEGNDFGGTFGSRVMMGKPDIYNDYILENLAKHGIGRDDLADCKRDKSGIKAFFELHIEQGGVLDDAGISVGIVSGIVGIVRYKITVVGEANHAGTTPMSKRKDALIAASKLICEMERISKSYSDPFVFTIGELNVSPGMCNIVPGKVDMVLEMRDLSNKTLSDFVERVKKIEISPMEISFEKAIDKPPVSMDPALVAMLEKICSENGIKHRTMPSSAGHDAKVMADYVPSAMVFVPSVNGISHNPDEFTEMKDIEVGTRLLFEALLRMAQP